MALPRGAANYTSFALETPANCGDLPRRPMDGLGDHKMSKTAIGASTGNVEAFSIPQFCAAYGIGKTFAFEEIRQGRLTARKAGARTLVFKMDAERWASSLPVAGAA